MRIMSNEPPTSSSPDYESMVGYRCMSCGYQSSIEFIYCVSCGSSNIVKNELDNCGTVISFTIQHVPGKEFLGYAPYAYVLVRTDSGAVVSGFMEKIKDPSEIFVGKKVSLSGFDKGAYVFTESR